jgi:hypothetical protein
MLERPAQMRQMRRERLERLDVRVVLQTVGVDEQPVNREVRHVGQVSGRSDSFEQALHPSVPTAITMPQPEHAE